jgi:hypothetical protein
MSHTLFGCLIRFTNGYNRGKSWHEAQNTLKTWALIVQILRLLNSRVFSKMIHLTFPGAMTSVTLVHPEETFTVPLLQTVNKCSLFQNNPALLDSPYRVQSSVSLSIFREFLSALEGKAIKITDTNFTGLQWLSAEFGLGELAGKLSKIRPAMNFKGVEDSEARGRIAALEEKSNQQNRAIVFLQDKLNQLSTDFQLLAGDVTILRYAADDTQRLSADVSALLVTLAGLSPHILPNRRCPPPPQQALPSPLPLDSRIISDRPEIFAEFRKNRFSLLWRGSRDGFEAQTFHRRCDGHGNTLTVILDLKGNIFGGFTPVAWESAVQGKYKRDLSMKSFVFTLKNPHNIPARKFALKPEEKHRAIYCDSKYGPSFGNSLNDIAISSHCHANADSCTSLGWVYPNETELPRGVVFTGYPKGQIKEIEVFELTD